MTVLGKREGYVVESYADPVEQTNTIFVDYKDGAGSIDCVLSQGEIQLGSGQYHALPKRILNWLEENRDEWYEESDKILGELIDEMS